MTKPTRVKVGWKDIDIDYVKASFKKDNTDCYGQYLNRENKIEIHEELDNDDLANTMLHEVMHAIVYHSSLNQPGGPLKDDESEEQTTNSLSNWLIGVFRDNPWFLDFLKENIHRTKKSKK